MSSILIILVYIAGNQAFTRDLKMRTIKAQEFGKPYQYEAAKKAERRKDIGRRSGRRGTQAWGLWAEKE